MLVSIGIQKSCIKQSMSFEAEQQQKIRHNGSRKKFSMYTSMSCLTRTYCVISMTNQIPPMR